MVEASNTPTESNVLFVYGTLRTGESRHHMLAAGCVLTIIPAWVPGRLVDFHEYPGLIPAEDGSLVHGELIELGSFRAVAQALDREEGPEYRRELRQCHAADGRSHVAWVYVFIGPADGARTIPSGDWLVR